MPGPLQILIIGSDARLRDECVAALVTDAPPVVQYVADLRQAIESARSRQPALAIVEMDTDLARLRALVDDLVSASPATRVVGAFTPEVFAQDISESAFLIEALRAGVADFLRRPVSAVDLRFLVERLQRQPAASGAKVGKLIAFISNKGGVGKSTLAVNVAVGLARKYPGRVLLVDASLQMGVCAALLDLRPALSMTDASREHARLDEMLLSQLATPHESGLQLLAAPADAVEGAEVSEAIVARVLSLARRTYDYIVVDTFPLFDAVVMAVLDQADEAYVIMDNVVPTLLGIEKFLKLLDSIGFPQAKQRMVLNRYSRSGAAPLATDAALRLDRDIDVVIPLDRNIVTSANLGQPFLLCKYWFSRATRPLRKLVRDAEQRIQRTGDVSGDESTSANGAT